MTDTDMAFKKSLKFDPITLARILILLEILALAVSTAVTNIVEIAIFLVFICFGKLRSRVFAVLKQPMVFMTLVIYLMVGLGVIYSVAPFSESMDMWGSWRKYLLVPLVAAVYDDVWWKQRFVLVFIGLMVLAALVSFTGYVFEFSTKYPVGIVISNHATQSMFFAAAIFACLVFLRFPTDHPIRSVWSLWAAVIILFLNLFFITPGRSGYLVFIVCLLVLIFWGTQGKKRVCFMVLVPLGIFLVMMTSPVVKGRIQLGLDELQTYEQDKTESSMGLRIVFWKNTFAVLKKMEHPVLGYGTSGFETAYAAQVEGQNGWQGAPTTDPHNQFLKILVEHGLVGFILFLLFIASFFRQPVQGTFYYLGIGILLAWCASSMFSGHFTTFHDGRFVLIWCGVLLAARPKMKQLNP